MMTSSADPSARSVTGQASGRLGPPRRRRRARSVIILVALLLAACSCPDPIERVRSVAGRPPTTSLPAVPGEEQPYPGLGAVPPRPETTPPAERRAIENALVADRGNARYVGQPLIPTLPRPEPPPSAMAPAAPLETPVGMLMGAEEAPPAPIGAPPAPAIAGARQVQAQAEAAPARPPVASQPPPERPMAASSVSAIALEELPPPPPPAMPDELPARAGGAERPPPAAAPILPPLSPRPEPASPREPTLPPRAVEDLRPQFRAPGAASAPGNATALLPRVPRADTQTNRPSSSPPQPSVVVDRSALLQGRSGPPAQAYALSFRPGTDTLVPQDRSVIANLASRRADATFQITGYADDVAIAPGLDLPLARARAVADALRSAGVPAEALELGASARPGPAGRGAEVRLIQNR